MSDQAIKPIQASASTPAALPGVDANPQPASTSGNAASQAGNSLPPISAANKSGATTDTGASFVNVGRSLHFDVSLDGSQPIIRVIDSATGEIIRSIPWDQASSVRLASIIEEIHLLDEQA